MASAQQWADRLGFQRAYGSYEELLADPEIEAVYNPLPNHMHLEWIKRAADHGKHTLCEKPLCLSASEVEEAIDYVRQKGVLLMEAFMYRFHPQWIYARDVVQAEKLGGVRNINSVFTYNNPDPNNIRNIKKYGGGGLYDIGCYCISSSRFLLGREPDRVLATVKRHPEWDTDISASAILQFGDTTATFMCGTLTFPDQYVTVHGAGGRLTVELPFNIHPDVPVDVSVTNSIDDKTVSFGPFDQYKGQFEAFSHVIRTGGEVPTPLDDALANQRVIDALFASEQSGGWEPVQSS
jgi:predicted dehydrogenase